MSAIIKAVTLADNLQPIEAVKLSDGWLGATIRSLCILLNISRFSQLVRIRRSPKLASALVQITVNTTGGPQKLEVLASWAIPIWATGLQISRLALEKQEVARLVQEHAYQAIARAFVQQATETEPAEAPKRAPARPNHTQEGPYASDLGRMFATIGTAMETRFTDIETRLAAREQEEQAILVRLKRLDAQIAHLANVRDGRDTFAPTLDVEQQRTLVNLLWSVRRLTGQPFGQLAAELAEACGVADLTDIPQPAWPEILAWVKRKMDS
jgi:hypothetical protein